MFDKKDISMKNKLKIHFEKNYKIAIKVLSNNCLKHKMYQWINLRWHTYDYISSLIVRIIKIIYHIINDNALKHLNDNSIIYPMDLEEY